jgi:translation initiation factor 3 subunit E
MIYPGYEEKREQVLKKLDELEEESKEIMQIIQNPVVVQQLKQDKMANIQFLKENFNVRFK